VTRPLPAALAAAFAHCEEARGELLELLAAMDAKRWGVRGQDGSWSMAEQVDHLIRSEIGTSKMARRLIRGDFQGQTRPDGALLFDSRLAAYPYPPLTAPDGLVPSTRPLPEAREELDAVHRRFVEELALFEGPDIDALAAPDPATGAWFTLGGWVRLQALHERHHVRQIRAVLEKREWRRP
jgi:DinB superfamily